MTTPLIIATCVLLLFAYVFDLTSHRSKIPSVVLLIGLGFVVKLLTELFGVRLPDFSMALPLFGTIGLILIVLEGALDLEVSREKLPFIGRAALVSVVPLLAFSFAFAFVLQWATGAGMQQCLANAIPLSVISSAVAIPTAATFKKADRDFVVYESSISDIIGVIFFNFVTLNDNIDYVSVFDFVGEFTLMIVISLVATVLLGVLLAKITHHVKYIPVTLAIILIYAVSKELHLPALVFILFFGLFLGNLERMPIVSGLSQIGKDQRDREVNSFHDMVRETTFLIRALFFLLFGFVIESSELLDGQTILWSLGIVGGIFLLRSIVLLVVRQPLRPLLFVAPRGLITILLFLGLPLTQRLDIVGRSMIIQVIILCALMMMIGSMTVQPRKNGTVID
ncbi:MAG TPA: hypothetical protein VK147_07505 [Candidatus Didemnitutus sp.]|nr:hypothetical protein [Candidatus Didemnitutus sp.]